MLAPNCTIHQSPPHYPNPCNGKKIWSKTITYNLTLFREGTGRGVCWIMGVKSYLEHSQVLPWEWPGISENVCLMLDGVNSSMDRLDAQACSMRWIHLAQWILGFLNMNILFPSALLHISIVRRGGFSANWRVRGGSFTRLCWAEGLKSNWVLTKTSALLITGSRWENHSWSKIWNMTI